jgi:hypothetical protein
MSLKKNEKNIKFRNENSLRNLPSLSILKGKPTKKDKGSISKHFLNIKKIGFFF